MIICADMSCAGAFGFLAARHVPPSRAGVVKKGIEMSKDYNNFDYLSVSVKSDQLNRILQCYRTLGWTEVKTEDDRQYYDMKYVRLRRPHKFPNKDRLQYLQVRMESSINSLVEITRRAHVKSNAALGALVLAAVVSAGAGLWLAFGHVGAMRVCGIALLAAACALVAAAAVICPVMRRRENADEKRRIYEKLRLTQSLIDEAATLVPAAEEDGLDAPAEESMVFADDLSEGSPEEDGEDGADESVVPPACPADGAERSGREENECEEETDE